MYQDQLESLRREVEQQFNEKSSARDKALSQADALFTEMNILRGKYNAYTELLSNLKEPSVKVEGE